MQKILVILFLFFHVFAIATHNRAGEITYTQTGPNTIEITVTTFTKSTSEADRPKIQINWGDGKTEEINRDSGFPQPYSNDININRYTFTHVYPSTGEFEISFEDANRNADVINIPNSVNIPFYVHSKVVLNPFIGTNSSPVLLYAPIDDACLGKIYIHNPGAYDVDGDVLKYSIVNCFGEGGNPIAGYTLPAGVTMDANSGDFIWNAPNQVGEYNFALLIEEYRNGYKVGEILRDMQVTVQTCPNNDPPVITIPNEICVEAGSTTHFLVKAKDPNVGDQVMLSAVSGMFSMAAPNPSFVQPKIGTDSVSSLFSWTPSCAQVRIQPYTVLFKAQDDGSPVNLFDLQTLSIKVIAPAPKNLTAAPTGTQINLNWNNSLCSNVAGYKIYRKENSTVYTPDTCETGMPAGLGYILIKTTTTTDTSFQDLSVVLGKNYCYRVVAYYSNGAESKLSQEICTELKKVVPSILNVSVNATSNTSGSVFIKWLKANDLDVLQHPGPYAYRVLNKQGVVIKIINDVNDTSMVDTLINTEIQQQYSIQLWNETIGNTYLIGTSAVATSPFLSEIPLDQSLQLSWNVSVPWTNDTTYIYKETSAGSGIYTLIDTTTSSNYLAEGLVNGQTYCFKIQTSGKYGTSGYPSPLLNYSQTICGVPLDVFPPCAPTLKVLANCDLNKNEISWKLPPDSCSKDLQSFSLYYKDELAKPYSLVQSLSKTDTSFSHENLPFVAGCYYITATDSTGNESSLANEVCVENCPNYSLPIVFTPNGDGQNDFFRPYPYKHIEKVDMKIYDRWGLLVFKTKDPNILWDGKFAENNQLCSAGTYYYICEVYQKKLEGSVKVELKGYVQVIY